MLHHPIGAPESFYFVSPTSFGKELLLVVVRWPLYLFSGHIPGRIRKATRKKVHLFVSEKHKAFLDIPNRLLLMSPWAGLHPVVPSSCHPKQNQGSVSEEKEGLVVWEVSRCDISPAQMPLGTHRACEVGPGNLPSTVGTFTWVTAFNLPRFLSGEGGRDPLPTCISHSHWQ